MNTPPSAPSPPPTEFGSEAPDGGSAFDPGPPPGYDPGPPKLDAATLRFFVPYLAKDRRRWWICAGILLLTGAAPAVMGLLPLLLTSNWAPGRVHLLWWGLGGLLAFQVLLTLLQFFQTKLSAEISQGFTHRMRLAVFAKLGRMPALTQQAQSIGALAQRCTGDIMRLQQWLTPTLPNAVVNGAQLIFMAAALLILGPWYALVAAVLSPLIWCALRWINRRLAGLSRTCQVESECILTQFIEGAGGYRDLVAAGKFHRAADRLDQRLDSLRRAAVRMSLHGYAASVIPMFFFTLLLFGYYFVKLGTGHGVGDMEYLGRVMSFAGLLSGIQRPVMGLASFFTESSMAAPSFLELRRLLEVPEISEASHPREPSNGEVILRDVSFAYGPGQRPTLHRLNFRLPAGSFTAIVGQTGSGKTTLFHLLLRLLEPTEGTIQLGGVPLQNISFGPLRECLGFIPQSPFIFDATLRENVLLGTKVEDVPPGRFEQAMKDAQLEELLSRRGGADLPVGPGGATLSGGERQRVALARIFLRDPDVIICDEYTANIDNATASLIQQALAQRFRHKTRVVITHQLYTIRGADQIIVLDRGTVSAIGTHQELVGRPGLYRDLWDVQRLD